MKKETLYEVLGDLDEDYIRDAHKTEQKKSRVIWLKWGAVAACLCVIVAALVLPGLQNSPVVPGVQMGGDLLLGGNNDGQSSQGMGNIKSVFMRSLPEGYEYSFYGAEVKPIVDYISGLHLTPVLEEIPQSDVNLGMTWVISLEYENGEIITLSHCAATYIRAEDGKLYEMVYEEATRLVTLLTELKGFDCQEDMNRK